MPPDLPSFCVHVYTNVSMWVFVPIRQTNATPSPLRSDYSSYAPEGSRESCYEQWS